VILSTGYKADGSEVPGKYHSGPGQADAGLWRNPVKYYLCQFLCIE